MLDSALVQRELDELVRNHLDSLFEEAFDLGREHGLDLDINVLEENFAALITESIENNLGTGK